MDIWKGIDMPSINQYSNNMSRIIAEQNQQIKEAMKPVWEAREKAQQAQIETANNTAEMKLDLKTVIENQNSMIKILEAQLKDINLSLDLIFGSVYDIKEVSEDSINIYSSINTQIMQGKKPDLKSLLVDKSGDIIIQVFFLVISGVLRSFNQS